MNRLVEFTGELFPCVDTLGIQQIKFYNFFRCQSVRYWALRAINPGIDHGIESELQAQLLLHKLLDIPDFMPVACYHDRLDIQWEIPLLQQPDSPQAFFK